MRLRLIALAIFGMEMASAQSPMVQSDPVGSTFATTIVVTGTVERDSADGATSLPPDARIHMDCHGLFFDFTVDRNGSFRYSFTPDPMAIAAANICLVEARAVGYTGTSVKFPMRQLTGSVDVGVLTVRRNASADAQEANAAPAGQIVSATSLRAPQDAVKSFEKGQTLLRQSKFGDAAKSFESAVKAYPEYAEGWLGLGRARAALKSVPAARDAFVRAAEIDPQIPGPPAELGLLAIQTNDLTAAVQYLDRSLKIDPIGTYQICFSDAMVNLVLKRYGPAERSAAAALRFGDNADHARADYVLGYALLARGANAEAKQRLLRYLELSPKAPERPQIERELARIDSLAAAPR